MADEPKHWIQGALSGSSSHGALHRATNTPLGQKIPAAKMAAAARSRNPRIRKMVTLAHTLGGFRK